MLRHLVLALFLISLSLPAMSVAVHAETAPVDCHGVQPAKAPSHKSESDAGKAAGHFCIGCVANPAQPRIESPFLSSKAAHGVRPMAALAGATAQPNTPPPRS